MDYIVKCIEIERKCRLNALMLTNKNNDHNIIKNEVKILNEDYDRLINMTKTYIDEQYNYLVETYLLGDSFAIIYEIKNKPCINKICLDNFISNNDERSLRFLLKKFFNYLPLEDLEKVDL